MTFLISHVIPADPAAAAAGQGASIEAVQNIRHQMGLDLPLHEQYIKYIGDIVLHGDFGYSILNRRPVLDDILTFVPASLELALVSLLLCVPLGILLGVISASRAGSLGDAASRAFAILGVSIPVFWLGLLLQLLFYRTLRWLPPGGRIGTEVAAPFGITNLYLVDSLLSGNLDAFVSSLLHILLPAITLAMANLAVIARMTRSSLLEVLHQDYVRTARSKGLSHWQVLFRHALRPAAIPVVTVVGLQLANLIAWVFLVETIFSWPGIGSYGVRAILSLDFSAIMGVTLFTSFVYVLINLVVDIAYVALDPRIRY
jgi:peptide/nickel transport system permease protein